MRLTTIAILLALTGCATQPLTPQQQAYRLQVLQMATQVHPYVLPTPQVATLPQTHLITCNSAGVQTFCTSN